MKKILLIMCILGVVLPYYHLINFLILNNGSMDGFWSELFSSHPVSMISMDLTVAATTFLIFLIYKKQKDQIKIAKYILSMFLVGFSLALPLYLYDNYNKI
jgi:amino acid permease|tara:strand:+ start:1347 stop:1649 length:303 start_codon:yes stop_codon:yes gene_type:complete